jgi:acetyltransferase-like isoleucine patch superfamily enzyme
MPAQGDEDGRAALARRAAGRGLRLGRKAAMRLRRLTTLTSARVRAAVVGSAIDFDVDPTVEFGAGVRFPSYPRTRSRVAIRAGARIGHDVHFNMRGGDVEIGPEADVRRMTTMNVEGELRLGVHVVLSVGTYIHCHERVTVGDHTIIGEYSTIADSNHLRTPPGVPVLGHVESRPVAIGTNVWVGTKAVITRGVTVGDQAFVGSNAVVTIDVEPGWLVAGIPARPIRLVPVVEELE